MALKTSGDMTFTTLGITTDGLHLYIDWDGDGDFSEAYEDMVGKFQKIRCEIGRDTELDRAETGQGSIIFVDKTGDFVTENPASPYYLQLLPDRLVQIAVTYLGVVWYIYTGFIDDILPDVYAKNAYMPLLDGFDQLRKADVNMGIELNRLSGELMNLILDAANWDTGRRSISAGIDPWPIAYMTQKRKALEVMHDVEQSEFGFLYCQPDGYAAYEDRHYRLLESRCNTSQCTLTGADYAKIKPLNPLQNVKTYIIIESQPKTKAGSASDLWVLQENASNGNSPNIGVGAANARVFWAGFADANGNANIAGDVVDPVAYTDYEGNSSPDGTGVDRTTDVTIAALVSGTNLWASGAKLTVTNNGGSALYLTKLKVRGKIFIDEGTLRVTSPATPPTTGRRDYQTTAPFYQTSGVLQQMADHIWAMRHLPVPTYEIELNEYHKSAIAGQNIRERRISDRITLQCSDYSINGDYFIEKIRHEITPVEWRTWWTVSKCDTITDYWRLGYSTLGEHTKLCF